MNDAKTPFELLVTQIVQIQEKEQDFVKGGFVILESIIEEADDVNIICGQWFKRTPKDKKKLKRKIFASKKKTQPTSVPTPVPSS